MIICTSKMFTRKIHYALQNTLQNVIGEHVTYGQELVQLEPNFLEQLCCLGPVVQN